MRSLRTKDTQQPNHSGNRRRQTNRLRRMLKTRKNRHARRVHPQAETTRQTIRSHSNHGTEKEKRNQSRNNPGNHRRLHHKDTPSPRKTRLNPRTTREKKTPMQTPKTANRELTLGDLIQFNNKSSEEQTERKPS